MPRGEENSDRFARLPRRYNRALYKALSARGKRKGIHIVVVRVVGNDVDHAPDRIEAEQCAVRAFDDLDLTD